MNIANLYRKIKQILNDSNVALVNKGLSEVDNLSGVLDEIEKLGGINYLPYVLAKKVIILTPEELGNDITQIKTRAFHKSNNLISVTIPESVTVIGNFAFSSCNNCKDIYLKPTTPPSLGNKEAIPSRATIHVPVGSGDAYKSATNWSSRASQIVEDIEI